MEENLKQFLRDRGIKEDLIDMMSAEKIDICAIQLMDDDMLSQYVPLVGDRLSLKAFCQQEHSKNVSVLATRKSVLLDRLRRHLEKRKTKPDEKIPDEKKSVGQVTNSNAHKTYRYVEIGWLHGADKSSAAQVRLKNGGGTRKISVSKTAKKADLLQRSIDIFFPDGVSRYGSCNEFACDLTDFKQSVVPSEMTVGEMYRQTGLPMLRFYLLTLTLKANKNCVPNTDNHREASFCPSRPAENCSTAQFCEESTYLLHSSNSTQSALCQRTRFIEMGTPTVTARLAIDCVQDVPTINTPSVAGPSASSTSCSTYEQYVDLVETSDVSDDDAEMQWALDASLSSYTQEQPVSDDSCGLNLRALLQSYSSSYFSSQSTRRTVVVNRRCFLASVLRAVAKPDFTFNKRVKIVFSGEDACDEGGPTREFMRLLMLAVSTEMGIFEGYPERRVFCHNIELLRRQHYSLAGKFVAWSLANGGPGLRCLSKQQCNLMLGKDIDSEQEAVACVVNSEYQEIFLEVTDHPDGDLADLKSTHADFIITNGTVNPHKLSGKEIALNLLRNYLLYRVSQEIAQFTEGLGELWQLFIANPDAMKQILSFNSDPLTLVNMKKLYSIVWSPSGSIRRQQEEDTVYYFECFLQDCEDRTRDITLEDILCFWTGSNAEPPTGFQAPAIVDDDDAPSHKPLTICFYSDKGRLPYANTCGLRLFLPLHVDDLEFNSLFTRSLTECVGFGKV